MKTNLIDELAKVKAVFQQRAILAALGVSPANSISLENELPCGCHDDPKYGHVVMAGCEVHD
jgi:hypothetical protein